MPSDERPGVLYVDDEAINLKVFEANFKTHFRILTCSSGAQALELIKSRSPEIAVVLADQRMPEMTGVEFCASLTAQDSAQASRVVLMSGGFSRRVVAPAVALPRPLLEKPFRIEQVLSLMRQAVRQEPLDPTVAS